MQGFEKCEDGTSKNDQGEINTILKLKQKDATSAFGGKGQVGSAIGDYMVWESTVMSIGELLWLHGNDYTASELYEYFVGARRCTSKRPHPWTNPERREAVVAHKGKTGRWGLGSGLAIGSVAWKGQVAIVR